MTTLLPSANPRRLPLPPERPLALPYRQEPVLVLEGMATDVTSATLRKRLKTPAFTVTRVGPVQRCIASEYEPGWRPALFLREGVRYRCSVHECTVDAPSRKDLPKDVITPTSCAFYNRARELADQKDEADQRLWLRGYIAVWTDGLSIRTAPGLVDSLLPGKTYFVDIRALPPGQ